MDLRGFEDVSSVGDISYMQNIATNYQVVIKRADIEKGVREVSAYKQMDSSALIDYSVSNGEVVMMLHRHDGKSLDDILKDKKSGAELSENLAAVTFSALCYLKKLHASGVSHGDISPKKIVIASDNSVKLIGYGRSCKICEPVYEREFGYYTPPEIALGGMVDPELSDLYSLGRSLFEVINKFGCADYDTVTLVRTMMSVIPERRRAVYRELKRQKTNRKYDLKR